MQVIAGTYRSRMGGVETSISDLQVLTIRTEAKQRESRFISRGLSLLTSHISMRRAAWALGFQGNVMARGTTII